MLVSKQSGQFILNKLEEIKGDFAEKFYSVVGMTKRSEFRSWWSNPKGIAFMPDLCKRWEGIVIGNKRCINRTFPCEISLSKGKMQLP